MAGFFEATDNLTEAHASFAEILSKLTEVVDRATEAFSIWMIEADSTVWGIDNSNKPNLLNKILWLSASEAENAVIN